jgi:hypothetical protein
VQRFAHRRAIYFLERVASQRDDPLAIPAAEQRLSANDQPASSGFSRGIDRGQSRDENDEPALSTWCLNDARRNGTVAQIFVEQVTKARLPVGRGMRGRPVLSSQHTHQLPRLPASGSSI